MTDALQNQNCQFGFPLRVLQTILATLLPYCQPCQNESTRCHDYSVVKDEVSYPILYGCGLAKQLV